MTNENAEKIIPKDQIDSPPIDEGSSGGSLTGGGQVLKKGPWTSAEDAILIDYVKKHGEGNWNAVQKHSGLSRCGKSCRLRWANHLRPNLKKGAFTPEEEQLIIELHANMGNKWARMAAHLPGRTDNEIKNYWNTRIKRRQRAGLPIYPPNVYVQASEENQQGQHTTDYSCSDKQPNELLQGCSFDIPDVMFDNYNGSHGSLSYIPPFPDMSVNSILNHGFGSPHCNFMNPIMEGVEQPNGSGSQVPGFHSTVSTELPSFDQFSDENSGKMLWRSGLVYPYDPDPGIQNLAPFGGAISGSHAFSNGNFSASRPLPGPVKLELPSLQYTDTNEDSWLACPATPPLETVDTYIQSPSTTVSLQSECVSPRNSGLLEALLHESQVLCSSKRQSSEKSSSSSITPYDMVDNSRLNLCETEWEDYNDVISSLGHSAAFVFNQCTLTRGSSLDEHPTSKTSSDISLAASGHASEPNLAGKGLPPHPDFLRPDALLGSGWLEESSQSAKDRSVFNGAIASLLGQDFCDDSKPVSAETSSTMQGFGLDSYPWRNMPPACQMSEFP